MSTPITINLPHQHGRVEARRRIEAGFAKVVHSLPGGAGGYSERWEGDRLVFSAAAMGQTVSGVIDVLDTVVKMEIVLPGVLGLLAGGLKSPAAKGGNAAADEEVTRHRRRARRRHSRSPSTNWFPASYSARVLRRCSPPRRIEPIARST